MYVEYGGAGVRWVGHCPRGQMRPAVDTGVYPTYTRLTINITGGLTGQTRYHSISLPLLIL